MFLYEFLFGDSFVLLIVDIFVGEFKVVFFVECMSGIEVF